MEGMKEYLGETTVKNRSLQRPSAGSQEEQSSQKDCGRHSAVGYSESEGITTVFDTKDNSLTHCFVEENRLLSPEIDKTILLDISRRDHADRCRYSNSVEHVETGLTFRCSKIRLLLG